MAKLPMRVIYTFIFLTSIVAVYAMRNQMCDSLMMLVFGFVGYFLRNSTTVYPHLLSRLSLGPGQNVHYAKPYCSIMMGR